MSLIKNIKLGLALVTMLLSIGVNAVNSEDLDQQDFSTPEPEVSSGGVDPSVSSRLDELNSRFVAQSHLIASLTEKVSDICIDLTASAIATSIGARSCKEFVITLSKDIPRYTFKSAVNIVKVVINTRGYGKWQNGTMAFDDNHISYSGAYGSEFYNRRLVGFFTDLNYECFYNLGSYPLELTLVDDTGSKVVSYGTENNQVLTHGGGKITYVASTDKFYQSFGYPAKGISVTGFKGCIFKSYDAS